MVTLKRASKFVSDALLNDTNSKHEQQATIRLTSTTTCRLSCMCVEVMRGLETSMLQQLKEIVDIRSRFGVGFTSSDAWDMTQIKVDRQALRTLYIIYSSRCRFYTPAG